MKKNNFFLSTKTWVLILIFSYNKNTCNTAIGQDILLIINYNHAHYESIPFLKILYQEYFPNIIFYGPQEHVDVELCHHHKGWHSYIALADAMEKYPDYTGYLFTNDDCIINPWNFKKFNKNVIWSSAINYKTLTRSSIQKNVLFPNAVSWNSWIWWPTNVGYKAIKSIYDSLNLKYKKKLISNCSKNTILFGFSDIVYIPARYKNDTVELCNIFAQKRCFLEIAIPTLCACLDDIENWTFFNGLGLWNCKNPTKWYSHDLDYIHPIKLSDISNDFFILDKFENARGR